jgi:histidinol-phosphate aminotransferase
LRGIKYQKDIIFYIFNKGANTLYEVIMETENIRLNYNESPYGLTDKTIQNIWTNISNIELNRYPDSHSVHLKTMYGAYAGVDKENILAGNGSDEMLSLIIATYISSGQKLLTLGPDFSMYDLYTSRQGGTVIKYKHLVKKKELSNKVKALNNNGKNGNRIRLNSKLDEEFNLKVKYLNICNEKIEKEHFVNVKGVKEVAWNVDDFILFGKRRKPSLIMFSNPNNPTGAAVSCQDIERILLSFPDINVVVDEAYFEFYGETMVPFINKYKNLIVTRTLSKAWGLAALRVGFLIACEERIKELKAKKSPYNVNSISQELAAKALVFKNEIKASTEIIIEERERVFKNLREMEEPNGLVKFYPSRGNFIYGESIKTNEIVKRLEEKSIDIRALDDNSFRITIGTSEENNKVIIAFKQIMDVISDVK